ncbi:MAG: carboxymuconolactone decarboxylase family protein [Firmicutes bacterium]|nr:carboxymuconolactone decarboxylase family protein [Bacillota bacterium]
MTEKFPVSNAFQTFIQEAPEQQKIWMETAQKLGAASKLDGKTEELAYIAVLASARLEGGLPFHVKHAKSLGATRDEIIGAVLVGLPAVGNIVIQALPVALQAFDND